MAAGDSLLPGFRFSPTDEELVAFYLIRKAFRGLSYDHVIGELDLYNFEPWDLPDLAVLKSRDGQWFFFGPRERRRRPGTSRNSRASKSGYWKTTGKDRKVSHGSEEAMGLKKTLVYYKGRTPHGVRTDWVMHEYRISEDYEKARSIKSTFVVCKVFKKGGPGPRNGQQYGAPVPDEKEKEKEKKESSESSAGVNQEEEEALMTPVLDGFELAPQVNNNRIGLPGPANTSADELHTLADELHTLADELFADLPTLANNMLFPNQYDCQIWPDEDEAMVLAETLQLSTTSLEYVRKEEEANGDLLSFYHYHHHHHHYYYSPQPKDFLDADELILPQFDDPAIAKESNDNIFQIGSLDAALMVKSGTQNSFDQPSKSSSQVRPEFQCPSLIASRLLGLLIIYFAIICIWIAPHIIYLLISGSELYESQTGYNLPHLYGPLFYSSSCPLFGAGSAVAGFRFPGMFLLFNFLELSLILHPSIHTYIVTISHHGEPSYHSSETSGICHCKQQILSGLPI